ncbi:hypothetical protein [Ferrovibrio sp.]|uniref:hypothetical protein n=1 Tax=Ferrovibrio sp. TaxID=1917215 RepID=UPI001B67840A|nr:hypothetical protein [Ferrovibrio sp.]MBP7063433.1 hypothetical protein [Ferrovibrio sp.]
MEPAQVIAGLVDYPSENLRFQYLMKIPVVQHYVAAWLLQAGLDERAVSMLFSGLLTAVTFQAWALLILAFCRRLDLALLGPLLIYASLAGLRGLNYPIILPPDDYGYGGFTIALTSLVVAYAAMGWLHPAALLAGLLPATHPVVGAWGAGITALVLLMQCPSLGRKAIPALLWGIAGLALSALIVLLHYRYFSTPPALLDAQHKQEILDYSRLHDGHRARITLSLTLLEMLAAILLAAGSALLLWRNLAGGVRIALLLLLANGLLGAIATSVYHWPDAWIPLALFSAMPNRFLNLNAALFAAGLIGLLAHGRNGKPELAMVLILLLGLAGTILFFPAGHAERGASATLLLLAATPPALLYMALNHRAGQSETMPASLRQGLRLAGLAGIGAGLLLLAWHVSGFKAPPAALRLLALPILTGSAMIWHLARASAGQPRSLYAHLSLGLAAAIGLGATLWQGAGLWRQMDARLPYFKSEPVLMAANARPGLLLFTGDYAAPQLWGQIQTRRPVLFDPLTVTALPYLGEQAMPQNALLRDVFGIDLFSRDPDCNYVSSPCLQRNWQQREASAWAELAKRHGFTDILVPGHWHINLPLIAKSRLFRLYSAAGADIP